MATNGVKAPGAVTPLNVRKLPVCSLLLATYCPPCEYFTRNTTSGLDFFGSHTGPYAAYLPAIKFPIIYYSIFGAKNNRRRSRIDLALFFPPLQHDFWLWTRKKSLETQSEIRSRQYFIHVIIHEASLKSILNYLFAAIFDAVLANIKRSMKYSKSRLYPLKPVAPGKPGVLRSRVTSG